MRRVEWSHREAPHIQLTRLVAEAIDIGYLVVEYPAGGDGAGLAWSTVAPWTRSRAVTVALATGRLASPALDVALCSDLVYLRPAASLVLSGSPAPPSDGVIWALGRAGRKALARGLLEVGEVSAGEALDLAIANAVVAGGEDLPLPANRSVAALTAARDVLRAGARGSAGLALELASFRLLFAAGDPEEGARAFLEKREPKF